MIPKGEFTKCRDDIVYFAERYYFLAPGKRIELYPYQKEILRECTRKDKDGRYIHKTSILSMPRQNGKSEMSTILGLHALFHGGYGHEILSVGIGGEQTAKVIFNKARRAIENCPALYDSIGDKNFKLGTITVPALDSTWEIKPSLYLSSIGRAFDLILFDELGNERVDLDEGSTLWDSLTAGQAAKVDSRRIVSSTVGGQVGKMWELIEQAGRDESVYLYLIHDNPSPLVTDEYLKAQREGMHPSVYRHWHENQYHSGADQFIEPSLYDSCIDERHTPRPAPKDAPCVMFIDLGIKHDISAAVTVYQGKDGRMYLSEIKSWSPKELGEDVKLDWIIDYLRDAYKRLNVNRVFIDEYQAAHMLQTYGRQFNMEGVHWTSQSLEQAWTSLISIMQSGELVLYEDKSTDTKKMRLEALNLTISHRGAGIKVSDPGKIHQDRILSLSGAVWKLLEVGKAERLNLGVMHCEYKWESCILRGLDYYDASHICLNCPSFVNGYEHYEQHMEKRGKKVAPVRGMDLFRLFAGTVRKDFHEFCKSIGGFRWQVYSLPRKD